MKRMLKWAMLIVVGGSLTLSAFIYWAIHTMDPPTPRPSERNHW